MIKWVPYPHENCVDMIPDDEVDYHYMNAVNPVVKRASNEDGELIACLCKPLAVYEDGFPTVYHRAVT